MSQNKDQSSPEDKQGYFLSNQSTTYELGKVIGEIHAEIKHLNDRIDQVNKDLPDKIDHILLKKDLLKKNETKFSFWQIITAILGIIGIVTSIFCGYFTYKGYELSKQHTVQSETPAKP